MNKSEATKYILFQLCNWYYELNPSKKFSGDNDLSILKSLKLIFFLCSIENKEVSLLHKGFNDFKALPLGPVEMGVYNLFNTSLSNTICNNKTEVKNLASISLSDSEKLFIDEIITELKKINYTLINNTARYLVDLTHEWSCWKDNYNKAKQSKKRSHPITIEDILNDTKIYSY